MVQAFINISEKTNRVLNIVKAKYGLHDKSQAIEVMTDEYVETILEPELRPEYIEKALKIKKQNALTIGTLARLKKRYE